jgi:hypothetical protein
VESFSKEVKTMNQYKEDIINWLLEEDNPPVRHLTFKNLLKDATAAQESRAYIMEYEVTQGILQHLDEFLGYDDKAYWKYKGKYWQLIFLGQFLADGIETGVKKIANSILENRKWIWGFGGQCLRSNILAALRRLGYADHPVVVQETEILAQQIVNNNGINCEVMDYSLLPQCYMAVPKVLLCFSEIPSETRSQKVKEAIEILVRTLLDNEVHVYVPGNRRGWQKILQNQPKRAELPEGQTVKAWTLEQKEKYLDTHGPGERDEKKGWLKFGFPLHYNSDILEAMYALARLNTPMSPNLKKPLRIIKEKMTPEGKWILENSLNGKMWIDVEEKSKPSKWLTYFALFVLNHFDLKNPSLYDI